MKILIVDDEANARYGMAKAIRGGNRTILEADNGRSAIELIDRETPDLIFLDLQMPDLDGLGVLAEMQKHSSVPETEIFVVTANDSITNAIECIKNGASDFLAKPYDVDHLRAIVNRSEKRVQMEQRLRELQSQTSTEVNSGGLIGECTAMKKLFMQISKAAKSHLAVLIRGESGTGKELVAQELHRQSDRASGPFIAVNTAAIPDALVESELFGHAKGAFTGADRPRDGVFRRADGGTLFLDEIGDMRLEYKPACCESCRRASCSRSAPRMESMSTFESSVPHTKIWKIKYKTRSSAKICIFDCEASSCSCLLYVIAEMMSCVSQNDSWVIRVN